MATFGFCRNPDKKTDQTVHIGIDVERLAEARRTDLYELPRGLSREEKRQFILATAASARSR